MLRRRFAHFFSSSSSSPSFLLHLLFFFAFFFFSFFSIFFVLCSFASGPALAWCVTNKARLSKLKSTLEFKLRLQQYVELVRIGARVEAIAHANAYFPEWSDRVSNIGRGGGGERKRGGGGREREKKKEKGEGRR